MKKNLVLHLFFLILLIFISASFAAPQHEGHDLGGTAPTTDRRLPGEKSDGTNCQRVTRLAAELDEAFDALIHVSDPAELRSQLSQRRVELQELRAAIEVCSQQCGRRLKRKGCGHMMQHGARSSRTRDLQKGGVEP